MTYLTPFKILIQKIPFLEYLVRLVKFVWNPLIETETEFSTGYMRYALWDIVSVISLFTVSVGLMSLFDNNNYSDSLSLFKNQFTFYFQFGFYAFWSTLMFFILTSVVVSVRHLELRFKEAFLCSFQYARYYALFLFLFFPLIAWYIHYLLYEATSIKVYVSENLFKSSCVLGVFTWLYVRCLIKPLTNYSQIFSNRKITAATFILLSWLAFTFNMYAPSIGVLKFDQKKACSIMLSNSKFKDSHISVKQQLLGLCQENITHMSLPPVNRRA
ncbi:hypothetical protein [Shewanella japonica]|uniref:hypothetical protein n=1 Tax=Shewanella japonica TaxID=93973 RepID=UPI000E769D2C|nr:hypothetical protein [Shewanella japonica]